MLKLSPRRNQRSNGFKVKHALQICVFGGACVWLMYQFQDKKLPFSYHHQEKASSSSVRRSKATPAAGNQNGFSAIKLGRKDLDPRGIEQMTAEDLKNGGQDAEEDKSFDDETKILEEIKVDDEINNGNGDEEPARNPEILDKKLGSGLGSGSRQVEMSQENKKKITKKAAALGGKGNVTVGAGIESKADKNSTQRESVESKGEKNSTQTESDELQKQELEKTSSDSTSGGKNENPVMNEQRSDMGESLKEEISSSGGVESAGSGEKINPSNDNDDTTDPSGENRGGEISTSQNESGSMSTSVLQEETDARTDLETMPQTETSGNALQATE